MRSLPLGNPQPGGEKSVQGRLINAIPKARSVLRAGLAPHPGMVFWQRRTKFRRTRRAKGQGGREGWQRKPMLKRRQRITARCVQFVDKVKMVLMTLWAPFT